jgi:hypothetical protein
VTGEHAAIGAVIIAGTVSLAAASYLVWKPVPLPPPPEPKFEIAAAMKHDFDAWPASATVVRTVPIMKPKPIELASAEQTPPPPEERERENAGRRDVCQRYGGHRIEFRRHHHAGWRCVYPRGRR